jgi:hypothetical protein
VAEFYPTPLAGQRLTASMLRSMLPQVARKTADTPRSATTTTTADPHLTFEVVANAVYIWHGWLKFDGPAGGDFNIDFTVPSGSLGEWTGWGAGIAFITSVNTTPALIQDTASTRGYLIRTETNDVSQTRSFGTIAAGTPLTTFLKGTLRVGSTAGTFSLDWAQLASDAGSTTLYTDSWLEMRRIA